MNIWNRVYKVRAQVQRRPGTLYNNFRVGKSNNRRCRIAFLSPSHHTQRMTNTQRLCNNTIALRGLILTVASVWNLFWYLLFKYSRERACYFDDIKRGDCIVSSKWHNDLAWNASIRKYDNARIDLDYLARAQRTWITWRGYNEPGLYLARVQRTWVTSRGYNEPGLYLARNNEPALPGEGRVPASQRLYLRNGIVFLTIHDFVEGRGS